MVTRSDKYRFEQDETKSRVAKNQELYEKIYDSDSYFDGDEKTSTLEGTNEIDIEKVKELLKGREIYRREMKLKELNMAKPSLEPTEEEEKIEEKNYDINAYLNKASSERVVEPYHKIDPENLKEPDVSLEEEKEEEEEPSLEELKEMGTTALSLDMFSDLNETTEFDKVDDKATADEVVATLSKTDTFFTDSVKLNLDEEDDDDDEKTSPVVKVVMTLLVLVIIALVVFLLFM